MPLVLVVGLDRPAGLPDEAAILRDAVHEFFHQRAHAFGSACASCFGWAGRAF
jgi:hypothetical protein